MKDKIMDSSISPPPCGVALYQPGPASRLRIILARVRELRANFYPPGWEADPLKEIERELAALVNDLFY